MIDHAINLTLVTLSLSNKITHNENIVLYKGKVNLHDNSPQTYLNVFKILLFAEYLSQRIDIQNMNDIEKYHYINNISRDSIKKELTTSDFLIKQIILEFIYLSYKDNLPQDTIITIKCGDIENILTFDDEFNFKFVK